MLGVEWIARQADGCWAASPGCNRRSGCRRAAPLRGTAWLARSRDGRRCRTVGMARVELDRRMCSAAIDQIIKIDRQQCRSRADECLAPPAGVKLQIGRGNDVLPAMVVELVDGSHPRVSKMRSAMMIPVPAHSRSIGAFTRVFDALRRNPELLLRFLIWVPAIRVPTKIAGHSSAEWIVPHRRFSWVPGAGTSGPRRPNLAAGRSACRQIFCTAARAASRRQPDRHIGSSFCPAVRAAGSSPG